MILDYFTIFVMQGLAFAIMLFISTWILIPKAVSYYSQWKSTGKTNFLSAASICFAVAGLCLTTDLVMFVSAFIRRI